MVIKKFTNSLIVAIVFLLSHACAPLATSTTAEKEVVQGSVLFSDDFSKPPSGWGIGDRGRGLVEYRDGGLHFQVKDTNFDFWSVAGKKFSDVQIDVDVQKRAGPDDNHFGIICRYIDKGNFYMLIASSDGYYGIAKLKDGGYSMIGTEQLQYSDVILPGRATNHMRVDCVGDSLSLYVNGVKLMEARDADFHSGDVGLVAGAYQEKDVDILFDQFVVKIPED